MSDSLDRFNRIASYYDPLSRLVFGKALYNSQAHFLESVPQGGKILIIGGGSGEILPFLMSSNPACRIWYVEASSVMLALAANRIRVHAKERINFIHGTQETIPPGVEFDAVISNFFLDLFPDTEAAAICQLLSRKLKTNGVWLVTDFVDSGKWWHSLTLWIMYRFFVITCKIKGLRLPAWQKHLLSTGMTERAFHSFCGNFIKSGVYQKGV